MANKWTLRVILGTAIANAHAADQGMTLEASVHIIPHNGVPYTAQQCGYYVQDGENPEERILSGALQLATQAWLGRPRTGDRWQLQFTVYTNGGGVSEYLIRELQQLSLKQRWAMYCDLIAQGISHEVASAAAVLCVKALENVTVVTECKRGTSENRATDRPRSSERSPERGRTSRKCNVA